MAGEDQRGAWSRPLVVTWAVLAILVPACASGDGDGGGSGELARRLPSTVTSSSSTSRPTTTVAPTTTSPVGATTVPATDDVVLGAGGLGAVAFGTEAAVALAALEARLGPPVDDRPLGSCPSGEADRLVQFAELSVLVADDGGVQRFVGWDFGLASGALPRLATAEGISVGSSLDALRSAYGERLALSTDDPFGPAFQVTVDGPGRLGGTLTGTSGTDTVATLSGGTATCAG